MGLMIQEHRDHRCLYHAWIASNKLRVPVPCMCLPFDVNLFTFIGQKLYLFISVAEEIVLQTHLYVAFVSGLAGVRATPAAVQA